jgi:hypothetical protein
VLDAVVEAEEVPAAIVPELVTLVAAPDPTVCAALEPRPPAPPAASSP